MNDELTLGLAFMAGLAGAGHCWAMCGGLVGGLFLGCGGCAGARGHVGYHLGRVLGYTGIGALAAALGRALVLEGDVGQGQAGLYLLAGLAVVGAGLWVLFLPRLRAGEGRVPLFASVAVATRSAAPRPSPAGSGGMARWLGVISPFPRAFLFVGLINALMPCALVYSLAVKAMTAPSVAQGAAWLFAFGLGSVPAMAAAGALAHWLGVQALVWLHRAAAVLVIALGVQAVLAGAEFFRVMGRL